MFSWIAHQVNNLSASRKEGPFEELNQTMRKVLQFEPVLTSALELEYKFHLEQITRATFEYEERVIVMDFLHYSFAPSNPNNEWRTIFNGLRILNALIDSGSSKVFHEVSEGKHFDVLQKTLFLSSYCNTDERISKLIRTSAMQVRDRLQIKFSQVDEEPQGDRRDETKSISSKEGVAIPVAVHLEHIASFKHTEDSSDDDEPRKMAEICFPDLL